MFRNGPSGPNVNLPTFPGITDHSESTAAVTIDWSKGPNQSITLKAATVTVTSIGLPEGESASLTLQVVQDSAGSRAIVFIDGDKANPFTLSTTAGSVDLCDGLWTGVGTLWSIRGKAYA